MFGDNLSLPFLALSSLFVTGRFISVRWKKLISFTWHYLKRMLVVPLSDVIQQVITEGLSDFSFHEKGGPLAAKLQQVVVPVINNMECEDMYRRAGFLEVIPDTFICAGYTGGKRDSCEVVNSFTLECHIVCSMIALDLFSPHFG